MRVVFSKPQNCPGFNDADFRDGGSAFQHMGPDIVIEYRTVESLS